MENSLQEKRITQLDGLRGLAVLMVISFHFINNQLPQDGQGFGVITKLLIKATYFGWAGVDLFFVLSGFLIGSILLRNRDSENFFKTFYVRRMLRIVPVFYLLLIVFFILKHTAVYSKDMYIFQNDIPLYYYFTFFQNVAMGLRNHFGPEALTPTWSLAVEEQFYLIIPLIIYFIKPAHLKYVIVGGIGVALASRYMAGNWYQRYTLLPCRLDSPLIGLAIALLMCNERALTFLKKNIVVVKIVALLLIVLCSLIYIYSATGVFNHTLIGIIFGLILVIVLCTTSGPIYRMLTMRWLVSVGAISYFIYLFHQLINGLLHSLLLHQRVPRIEGLDGVAVTLFSAFITVVAAYISYRFFEQPLIRYSHKYSYK